MTFDENINGRAEPEGHSIDLPGVNLPIQRLYRTAIDHLGAELDEGHWFFREIGLHHAEAFGPAGSLVLLVWPDEDDGFAQRLIGMRESLNKSSPLFVVVFTERASAEEELKPLLKAQTGLMLVNGRGEIRRRGQKNRALKKSLRDLKPSHEPIMGWYQRQQEILRETRLVRRGIEQFRASLLARPVTATRTLLVLLACAFLIQFLLGGASPPSLVRLGAGVLHGGLFEFHPGRLLGSMMLHGNLIHVAVNGLALHIAGGLVERLYGSARLLLVLALSGVAGALASHFSGSAPFSVGFSGALFGLFGVLGGLVLQTEESELPRGVYRQFRRQVFVTLLLNAGISFLPMIDAAAHFGGAAAGFMLVATRSTQTLTRVGRSTWKLRGLLILLLAGMVGSYAAFLKESEPWVLWEDPVEISQQETLGIPVPKSLLSRPPSLDQTPDGMTMLRFGEMGDAYSISAGRRDLRAEEVKDFQITQLLEEVRSAFEDAKEREGFEMSGQPRAVSRQGLEWVEVEFEAPAIGVVVNQYVGVQHGNVYHYRLERLDSVPAAVRLAPTQMWLTFFKDSTLLLE